MKNLHIDKDLEPNSLSPIKKPGFEHSIKKFNEDISNKFMKSLIKNKNLPVFITQGVQTEGVFIENCCQTDENWKDFDRMVKILEDDVNKLRIENIRLDKSLKTAQNSLALRGQVTFIKNGDLCIKIRYF